MQSPRGRLLKADCQGECAGLIGFEALLDLVALAVWVWSDTPQHAKCYVRSRHADEGFNLGDGGLLWVYMFPGWLVRPGVLANVRGP